ncbi:glycosyltransferase [Rhodococcus sp. WMMA185]|uniref:GtrA family protein n=1 Tax=Rhodococcus sp. WMMA185 TaxID=679318 RepID=UPI00087847FB|nr:GtrA family protein [Rhodococcus sp. WMMA185]AOW91755.1 glycosyltransferase [Rhodococcus sp. WMMA185]
MTQLRDAAGRPTHSPVRGPTGGMFAQLTRFTLVGTASNVLYAVAFFMLDVYGLFVANLVGVVLSSMLANELHRRHTFHATDRVRWFVAQWEGGTLAVIGLGITSLALLLLQLLLPDADGLTQAALVIAVTTAVGGLRFFALRGWVFAR